MVLWVIVKVIHCNLGYSTHFRIMRHHLRQVHQKTYIHRQLHSIFFIVLVFLRIIFYFLELINIAHLKKRKRAHYSYKLWLHLNVIFVERIDYKDITALFLKYVFLKLWVIICNQGFSYFAILFYLWQPDSTAICKYRNVLFVLPYLRWQIGNV